MEIEKYSKNLLKVVTECLNEMTVNDDLKSMMLFICESLTKITNNEYGFIGEILKDKTGTPFLRYRAIVGEKFKSTYSHYYNNNFIKDDNLDLYDFDSLFGIVYKESKIIYSNDLANDPRRGGKSKIPTGHPHIKNFLGLPLIFKNKVIGIVGLANYEKDYDDNYVEFIKPFIPLITNIIVNYHKKLDLIQQKNIFLSNMSHEVRTPLNGIVGMGQFLMDTPLTTEQLEIVNIINKCSLQLLSFINDLLDFSKMLNGTIIFDNKTFNFREVLGEATELFLLEIKDRKIKLDIMYDNKMPDKIIHDRQRIQQIIVNLISNAVKFTNGGKIDIYVKVLEYQVDNSIKFELLIVDNGCGIPDEKLEEIKENLSRQEHLQFNDNLTNGLGLPITKFLVDKMGGELDIKSMEGYGTKVKVILTLPYEKHKNIELYTNTQNSNTMVMTDKSSEEQVLIICDNTTHRLKIVQILMTIGLIPLPVSNIDEANVFINNKNSKVKGVIIIIDTIDNIYNIFSTKIEDRIINTANTTTTNHRRKFYEFIMNFNAILKNNLLLFVNPSVDCDDTIFNLALNQYKMSLENNDNIYNVISNKFNSLTNNFKPLKNYLKKDLDKINILSVEDNFSNQKVLEKILNEFGFSNIKQVYDGVEFIDELKKGKVYNIAFIDLRMPRMDGIEAVKAIIKNNLKHNTYFVALTATVTEQTINNCFANGMDGFLEKPIKIDKLRLLLELIINKYLH
jgi:signal transduction histidine kinase/CheY-like chemotaxis protein